MKKMSIRMVPKLEEPRDFQPRRVPYHNPSPPFRLTPDWHTYWRRPRRWDPCALSSCAPWGPRRPDRACGTRDSWWRSGRRWGSCVAGTQHAVAAPFWAVRDARAQTELRQAKEGDAFFCFFCRCFFLRKECTTTSHRRGYFGLKRRAVSPHHHRRYIGEQSQMPAPMFLRDGSTRNIVGWCCAPPVSTNPGEADAQRARREEQQETREHEIPKWESRPPFCKPRQPLHWRYALRRTRRMGCC